MQSSRKEEDDMLMKVFLFDSFLQAIDRMSYCAEAIDNIDHHPEWMNSYNEVSVVLTTHNAGQKVTEKDHQVAKLLDVKYLQFLNQS